MNNLIKNYCDEFRKSIAPSIRKGYTELKTHYLYVEPGMKRPDDLDINEPWPGDVSQKGWMVSLIAQKPAEKEKGIGMIVPVFFTITQETTAQRVKYGLDQMIKAGEFNQKQVKPKPKAKTGSRSRKG